MAEVASAFVSLIPSAKGFGSRLNGAIAGEVTSAGRKGGRDFGQGLVDGAERPVKSGFSGMAKAAGAAFAAVGAVNFLKDSVAQASDLSESMSKVGVVFGDSSEAVLAFSQGSSKALGQSQAQVLAATGTFGNLLRSVGLTEQKSAEFSTSMVKLASDMASFNNTSPEEALEALRAGLVGETEPLKRFGVNMNEAALKAEALALGIHKGKGPLDSNAKAQAAYSLIMKQTSLAQGDFERTSGGLANQQRILAAQVDDLKGKIGAALLPVLTRVAGVLTGTVIPAFANVGGFLRENQTTVKVIAALIASVLVPALISWGVQATIAGVKSAAAWVAAQLGAIKSAATQAVAFAGILAGWVAMGVRAAASAAVVVAAWVLMGVQSLLAAAKMAAAWLIAMGPIGWAIAAIVALVALVVLNWDKVKAATAAVWKWVSEKTVAAWNWVKQVVGGAVSWLWSKISAGFALIKAGIQVYVNAWRAVIAAAWRAIKAIVAAEVAGVKAVIGRLGTIVATIRGFFTRAKDAAGRALNGLVQLVKSLPGKIAAAFGDLGGLLYEKGRQVIEGLINGIRSKAGDVAGAVGDIAGKIGGFFPGSPVKEGPLRSLNHGHAGGLIASMLADGMVGNLRTLDAAADQMASRAAITSQVQMARLGVAGASHFKAVGGDGAVAAGTTINQTIHANQLTRQEAAMDAARQAAFAVRRGR